MLRIFRAPRGLLSKSDCRCSFVITFAGEPLLQSHEDFPGHPWHVLPLPILTVLRRYGAAHPRAPA